MRYEWERKEEAERKAVIRRSMGGSGGWVLGRDQGMDMDCRPCAAGARCVMGMRLRGVSCVLRGLRGGGGGVSNEQSVRDVVKGDSCERPCLVVCWSLDGRSGAVGGWMVRFECALCVMLTGLLGALPVWAPWLARRPS